VENLPPKISIIIPCYGKYEELTKPCLACISTLSYQSKEVIVVDDASPDGTAELVARDFPEVKVIRNERNEGYGTSCNKGACAATGEFLMFLNNDTLIKQKDFLERMISAFAAQPSLALVSPVTVEMKQGIYHDEMIKKFRMELPPRGACLMVPRRIFDLMGGFCQSLMMYGEDLDFCLRIGKADYPMQVVKNAEIFHIGAGTTRDDPSRNAYFAGRNFWIMMKRNFSVWFFSLFTFVEYAEHFGWLLSKWRRPGGRQALICLFKGHRDGLLFLIRGGEPKRENGVPP